MCSSQEIKEGHLAYYGSLDNISLTNDHRMFIARQLEKQLSSRRRGPSVSSPIEVLTWINSLT